MNALHFLGPRPELRTTAARMRLEVSHALEFFENVHAPEDAKAFAKHLMRRLDAMLEQAPRYTELLEIGFPLSRLFTIADAIRFNAEHPEPDAQARAIQANPQMERIVTFWDRYFGPERETFFSPQLTQREQFCLFGLTRQLPFLLPLPSFQPLSVADFVNLGPVPVYPIGLMTGLAMTDGSLRMPHEFWDHDVEHASKKKTTDLVRFHDVAAEEFVAVLDRTMKDFSALRAEIDQIADPALRDTIF